MENQDYIQNHAFETVDNNGTINDCPYIKGTDEYNLWIKTYDEYLNSLELDIQ